MNTSILTETIRKERFGRYHPVVLDEKTILIQDALGAYLYVAEGEEKTAVIDSGMGFPGLGALIGQLTSREVLLLNTHGHLDHVGGNDEFPVLFLHPLDWELFQRHGTSAYRASTIEAMARELQVELSSEELEAMSRIETKREFRPLSDGQIVDLGGRQLQVLHTPGHTRGSVCFYDRERQALFSGDTVCSRGVMLNFPESVSVEEFLETIVRLKERTQGVRSIYPGHHKVPLDASYLDKYLECGKRTLAHPENGVWEESACGVFRRYSYEDISLTY